MAILLYVTVGYSHTYACLVLIAGVVQFDLILFTALGCITFTLIIWFLSGRRPDGRARGQRPRDGGRGGVRGRVREAQRLPGSRVQQMTVPTFSRHLT